MAYHYDSAERHQWADNTFLDGRTEFSMHCWWKPDNTSADHHIFGKWNTGSGGAGIAIVQKNIATVSGRTDTYWIRHKGIGFDLQIEGAANVAVAGAWSPVGVSWKKDGNFRLYIDGAEDANSPIAGGAGTFLDHVVGVQLGWFHASFPATGTVDAAAFWGVELTANDFASLAGHHPSLVQRENLIFCPRMYEGTSGSIVLTDPYTKTTSSVTATGTMAAGAPIAYAKRSKTFFLGSLPQ